MYVQQPFVKQLINHFDTKLNQYTCFSQDTSLFFKTAGKENRKRSFLRLNSLERGKMKEKKKQEGGLCILVLSISSGMSLRTTPLEWELSNMIDGFSCYLQVENSESGYFFIGLTAYWYKSYFYFAAELICNSSI